MTVCAFVIGGCGGSNNDPQEPLGPGAVILVPIFPGLDGDGPDLPPIPADVVLVGTVEITLEPGVIPVLIAGLPGPVVPLPVDPTLVDPQDPTTTIDDPPIPDPDDTTPAADDVERDIERGTLTADEIRQLDVSDERRQYLMNLLEFRQEADQRMSQFGDLIAQVEPGDPLTRSLGRMNGILESLLRSPDTPAPGNRLRRARIAFIRAIQSQTDPIQDDVLAAAEGAFASVSRLVDHRTLG